MASTAEEALKQIHGIGGGLAREWRHQMEMLKCAEGAEIDIEQARCSTIIRMLWLTETMPGNELDKLMQRELAQALDLARKDQS
ncbi:hypothetical protein [Pseudomonas piscis]